MIFSLAGCQQGGGGPINAGSHNREDVEDNNNDNDDTERPEVLPTPADLPPIGEDGDDAPVPTVTGGKNYTADWEGEWLSDDYSDFIGMITVTTSSTGDLDLTFRSGDKTKTISGKETNYDEASYDYGTYVYANLQNNDDVTIRYSKEPDQTYITYDGKNPIDDSGDYIWITFYKFEGGYHIAPADYDDSDRYGKFSRKDPQDSDYFYAESDDFIVEYRKSDSMYNGTESISCESYALTSYGPSGSSIGWKKTKYIFEQEDDAIQCYNYQHDNYNNDYYKYYRDGNIVYQWYRTSGNTKMSQLYGWYLNSHYNIGSPSEDYLYYTYISKPLTAADFSLSLEDILYYRNIRGSHYCLDSKDAYLDVYIGQDSISLYPYCDGDDYYRGSGYSVVKVDGMKIYTIVNDEYYKWINGNNYEKAVIIQEYEFNGDEAVVTEYQFKVDDPDNSGITIDNFKSMTPDNTISHRFDMTRLRAGTY